MVTRVYSWRIESGRVIATHPGAGARRPGGASVALVVSRGAPTTFVGKQPIYEDADPATQTLYVTNSTDGTVSLVNMKICNVRKPAGCKHHWPVIHLGGQPFGIAVDSATNTVYVTNAATSSVMLFDAATCNATDTSGCGQTPIVVPLGTFPPNLAIDSATNMVYIVRQNDSSVSVIDGNTCKAGNPGGCQGQPFVTVPAGGGASGLAVNPNTNTVYIANTGEDSDNNPLPNGDTLSVINGATCLPISIAGCNPLATVAVGVSPAVLAIDPATDTLYVTNTYDGTGQALGTVSIVDGTTCNATNTAGCQTQQPPQIKVQGDPGAAAFDPTTGKVYIGNSKSNSVSIISGLTCSATNTAGCKPAKPATPAGKWPGAILPNSATDTVYVVDTGGNVVTLLKEH
jgi:DNA-binding beta-propeller fold protein YncE